MSKNIRFVAEIFDPETDIVSERAVVIEKEMAQWYFRWYLMKTSHSLSNQGTNVEKVSPF